MRRRSKFSSSFAVSACTSNGARANVRFSDVPNPHTDVLESISISTDTSRTRNIPFKGNMTNRTLSVRAVPR